MKNKIMLILSVLLILGCVFAIPAFASAEPAEAPATEENATGEENAQIAPGESKMTFKFDPASLVRSEDGKLSPLAMMGLGMVGIFIVTLVIVAVVYGLNKINIGEKKDNN